MANWFATDERSSGYSPVTLEAHDIVFGDRNVSYGHPLDDFSCTAAMWTAYLRHRGLLPFDEDLTAEDVGPMMIMVKLSRQANAPKRDSMVDVAGYAETTERVIFERERRRADEWPDDEGEETEEQEDALLCDEGECWTCDKLHAEEWDTSFLTGFGAAVESALAHELGLTAGDLSPRESFPRSAPDRLAELFSLLMLG